MSEVSEFCDSVEVYALAFLVEFCSCGVADTDAVLQGRGLPLAVVADEPAGTTLGRPQCFFELADAGQMLEIIVHA